MEVVVTTGDGFRPRIEGEGDSVVILRVAAECRWLRDVRVPLTEPTHLVLDSGAGARLDILRELRATEDVDHFLDQVVGDDRRSHRRSIRARMGPRAPGDVLVAETNTFASMTTRYGGAPVTRRCVPPGSLLAPSWRAPSRRPQRSPRPCGTRSVTCRYTLHTPCVYDWCMSRVRTNIEIEDSFVQAIMDRYGVRTKTDAVDLALRHLAGQPMTREEAIAMRGAHAIGEIPQDSPPRGAA